MTKQEIPKWLFAGAYCADRNKNKIRVICTDRTSTQGTEYTVLGLNERGVASTYTPDGMWTTGGHISDQDLVGPWVDPIIIKWPWHLLPPWFNWCAFSAGGQAFTYAHKIKPTINIYSAWTNNYPSIHIPKEYAPEFTGDWEQSLTERPKNDER